MDELDRPMQKPIRDAETKASFLAYLEAHPELRFWQTVRNWSNWSFIIASESPPVDDQIDTFYLETRDQG